MKKDDILEEERLLSKKRVPDVIRRIRILYVKEYLEQYTDEKCSASMWEILKYLDKKGIPAERKSVRDDIIALRDGFDMEIELENGKQWKLISREFDMTEFKLIVDCIASSKFLSENKSKQLIEKLEKLVSVRQRRSLNRQVLVSGRVRSMNESAIYALNDIYEAINSDMCIDFKYYQYNMEKKREYKHDGKIYHVYPRHVVYNNSTYYLLADEGKELKTFRVDRMANVKITEEDNYHNFGSGWINTASYVKSTFGMYHGEETEVTMLFNKNMMDVVVDRFGESVIIEKVDDEHFRIKEKIAVSPQFFGWVFGLGENVMIEYPLAVAKQMKDMLKERHKAYREAHSGAIYLA